MNPVFSRLFPLHAGDQRRIPRDCDALTSRVSSRDKTVVETVWELTANRLNEIFRMLIGCVGYEFAPRAQKIRRPSSGGG